MKTITKNAILLVAFTFATFYSFASDLNPKTVSATPLIENVIHWENTSTVEVKFFIVQRSKDALNYQPVAMVHTIDNQSTYSFTDTNIGEASWLYRIVEVDANGLGTFSYALSVTNNSCASKFVLLADSE